ncbi:portal protein [Psychrobacillus phage Perkons]|nr:portal protein [Psychrobacillus phage Perkons]
MQEPINEEYSTQLNSYQDYLMDFTAGYINKMFSQGIIKEVDAEQLKKYFSNPDLYQGEIDKLAQYFYIINAEIHTTYELIESLPMLNYRIDSFDKNEKVDKYMVQLNKILNKVKHKRLTRDLLKQNATTGNLAGMWIGSKTQPYAYVFDDIKYIEAVGRDDKGDWICLLDMSWFDSMNVFEQELHFGNLSPHVTKSDYEDYKKNLTDKRYHRLPSDRTFYLRTGVQKRNQAIGTSWVTSALNDVQHKKKLKDVEQSIANKVINAVAVLTIGSEKHPEHSYLKLNKGMAKSVHTQTKQALQKNSENGVTLIAIPEFTKIDFPDVNTDGLNGDKFDHINSDIQSGLGLSGSMMNGEGGNFSSAKINYEILYKRLAVMLEDVEQEVYQKLFNIALPSNQKDNFYMTYDKEIPLTMKEKLDILSKLNDKGWSTKHLVDMIPNIDWQTYLDQTLYETEDLELQLRIKPYLSSYTSTSKDVNGTKDTIVDPTNANTIKARTNLPT